MDLRNRGDAMRMRYEWPLAGAAARNGSGRTMMRKGYASR